MKPVIIDGWCTLYHADNAEIVDVLRGHEPDAVITDPPYGLGLKNVGLNSSQKSRPVVDYRTGVKREWENSHAFARGYPSIAGDDVGATLAAWLEFPQVLVWGADHLRSQLPTNGRFLAWDKLAGLESWDSFSDVEFAWHSRFGKAGIISHRSKGVVSVKAGEENGKRYHPMQKPIRVMEWCIEQCRLERGATILDPYMGSGTTAIAAFKRGMQFVGVEIDRRWFDVAVERIKRQTGDGPLFEAPQEPQEVPLFAEAG